MLQLKPKPMINFFTTLSQNTRSIIAVIITLLSFAFLFLTAFHVIPISNQGIVNTAIGFILSAMSGIAGYYFGSAKDASDKQKADILKNQQN